MQPTIVRLETRCSVPRPTTTRAFREAVEGKTPAVEIARALNVSRQTAYQYLKGNTSPRPDQLALLVHKWGFVLRIGEHSFGKGAFGKVSTRSDSDGRQMKLDFEELADGTARIRLPGTDSTLRLGLKGSTLNMWIDLKRSA